MTGPGGDLAPLLGSAAIVASVGVAAYLVRIQRAEIRLSARPTGFGRVPGLGTIVERLVALSEGILHRRGSRKLNRRLDTAGVTLRPAEYLLMVTTTTVVVFLIATVRMGPPAAIVAAGLTPLLFRAWIERTISRRREALAEQLPDTLQLMASTLRAGYGLMYSVEIVGQRAPEPTAQEFRRVLIETRLGRGLHDALAAMADRLQITDLHWVVQAITIHQEVGGDLTEVLDTVGGTVHEREQIRGQVRALSAEGRLSGAILLALPVVLALGLTAFRPGYLSILTTHPLGWLLIASGSGLLVAGGFWIRRLLRLVY